MLRIIPAIGSILIALIAPSEAIAEGKCQGKFNDGTIGCDSYQVLTKSGGYTYRFERRLGGDPFAIDFNTGKEPKYIEGTPVYPVNSITLNSKENLITIEPASGACTDAFADKASACNVRLKNGGTMSFAVER